MRNLQALNHSALLILGIGLIVVGILPACNPRRVKNSFSNVSEGQRPNWSYMPLWYYRTLGVVVAGIGTLFLLLYVFSRT